MSHQPFTQVRVRPMRPDELGFAATQHLQHFPDGFFARLGQHFLEEYYRAFLTSPHARLLVAEDRQGPVGYLAGILRPDAHRAHVLAQHRWPLIFRAAGSLARQPSLLIGFLRTRSRIYARKLMRHEQPAAAARSGGTPAVLAHIVVDPSRHGHGIGRQLMLALSSASREAGCTRMVLVTEQGAASEAFYRHLQWVEDGTHHTRDGKAVTTFHQDLAVTPDAETETKGVANGD